MTEMFSVPDFKTVDEPLIFRTIENYELFWTIGLIKA